MSFNHLFLEPEKCLISEAYLFYCTLSPIPCHFPQNLDLTIFPFLSSIFNIFLLMDASLNHKTYYAFLIIKQRTIESFGLFSCQPIIPFSFLVIFLTCLWYSRDYFLLVLNQSLVHMAVLTMVPYMYLNYRTLED